MDELPTIKKMTKVQLLMREALKSAPPLQISQPTCTDFIVFESKTSSNTIFDRLLTHKSVNSSVSEQSVSLNPNRRCSQTHKWSQLKSDMKQDLENKRMQFWKDKQINDKLEDEELEDNEEFDEELDGYDNQEKDVSDAKHINEEKNEENELICDESEDNSEEEEEENESDVENDGNEDGDSNPFIDNEAREEEEEEEEEEEDDCEAEDNCETKEDDCEAEDNCEVKEEKELDCHYNNANNKQVSDDSGKRLIDSNEFETKDLVPDNEATDEILPEIEDKCNDLLDESVLNTSITSLDELFTKRFATQNIALSPFNTQPKYRSVLDNGVTDMLDKESDNKAEEFDSQTLLGLCSGNFSSDVQQMSDKGEEVEDDDVEDNILSQRNKRTAKIFNIDSESDQSDDDEVKDSKPCDDSQQVSKSDTSPKRYNESDCEELIVTEAEDSNDEEDNGEEVEEKDIEKLKKGFIEDEAELSGSEVSSDEDDEDDDYDELPEDQIQEELPSEDELRNQNEKFYNKKLLDEDKRELLIMKEMLLEDGDLHEDGKARERKFRWNFDEDNEFVNNFINEDSDYENGSEDDENIKTPALRMFDESNSAANNDSETSIKSKFKLNFDVNGLNKGFQSRKMNSISSFVVRDQRLKGLLSKRTLTSSNQSKKPTKRLKSSNNSKPSIFDLLYT